MNTRSIEHWLLAGGLFTLAWNLIVYPFYKYVIGRALFTPAWDAVDRLMRKRHPVVHAQFAHYHRRHEAPNPSICEVDPCVVVP